MASSLKPERIYHVFLSFRGEDVRNSFLNHLYTTLDHNGFYTYVDSKELRKGEQIAPTLMKAIEESHIAIIVFSKNYASSRWCLEEVAKIMDCKEEIDLTVFPLFYKVDPGEVRTPRERYKKAMVEHESKLGKDSKALKRWEKALSDASNLSGWHLKDGDESELLQRIVTEISTHLNWTLLHVAMHPVGIESRVVRLKWMLNLKSNDVLMVGLWGHGGIGKTTLAKAVYNDIFRQFENSCFLANVREISKDCKDLIALQEKLLFETLALRERLVVSNVDRGINLIQERLCHKKVFLILDDVNDLHQLHALVGEGKWFHNGSRIIITTRDNHLLTYLGIDQDHVYEVRELDDNDARELFMDSVLNHAKGLPLALEVLGSFLRGRREYEWESALDDISTAPKKGINDVLKISYDGLEPKVKEIFLHIACFFKGWDSEYVKKILMERSLIRIESGNIQMHDLIQLMGMDIVIQESDDLGRRSRLWLYDDVVDVLSSNMGNCAVKAIVLQSPEPTKICIGPDALTKMRRMRLLILCNINFSQCQSLVCMLDLSCTPNLEELYLQNCKNLVEAHESIAYHEKLQVLDFRGCSELSVFPNELKLGGTAIKELPASIENLVSLEEMHIHDCKDLEHLPSSIYKLQNLENLHISSCTNLVEFTKYEDLVDPCMKTILSKLNLSRNKITSLPTSISKRHHLSYIRAINCHQLQVIPELPPFLRGLRTDNCKSLQNYGDLTSVHDFVHRGIKCKIGGLRKSSKYKVILHCMHTCMLMQARINGSLLVYRDLIPIVTNKRGYFLMIYLCFSFWNTLLFSLKERCQSGFSLLKRIPFLSWLQKNCMANFLDLFSALLSIRIIMRRKVQSHIVLFPMLMEKCGKFVRSSSSL
ncbi:hypothetical protein EUGRSUZ_E02206 [Eucalyptus grandis]|uniref:TIR domain-containing protein n=2 Tax=Eucalyptus grandis TaxID=71139 RepID=A0A059C5W7_EUCGR|nr:hypothetical protein EUGRSUZ_E02206 [Eucalyptus grandis]